MSPPGLTASASEELQRVASRLLESSSASRVTIRLRANEDANADLAVVAEAVSGTALRIGNSAAYDLLSAPTVQALRADSGLLIQRDCLNAEPRPPSALTDVYGVTAQMLGPLYDDDGLHAIVSVHATDGPRDWSDSDISELRRAMRSVSSALSDLTAERDTAGEGEGDGRPTILVQDVHREYTRADGARVEALRGINLTVNAGQFVCVVGPSGGGKTTLLSVVAGLVEPTAGRVEVSGKHVLGPGPDRGVVFQKDTVFPWMRVVANVEYGLRCRGVSKTERRGIAMDYLEAVGLHDVAHAWPRELSGGMLKRVAVATVFANGANVLLLDEPFGSLDYVTRHQLHGVLLRLWQEERGGERRVVLFVTHDVDEALTLADRVIVVRDGLLIDDVTIAVARPRTVETLARSEMLGLKHLLLGHLGLESATRPEKLQEQIAKSGSVTESMRRRTNERSAR